MRVVIDMQGMQTGSRYRGIGRYTQSLVHAIIRNGREHEIFLLLSGLFPETIADLIQEFSKVLHPEQIKIWEALGPTAQIDSANDWRRVAAKYMRNERIKQIAPDIVLLTTLFEGYGDNFIGPTSHFSEGDPYTAAILYDLIPLMNPTEYLADYHVRQWYDARVEILRNCSLLLAISDSSRNEGVNLLGYSPERIVNISSAADKCFQKLNLSLSEKLKIRKKFDLPKEYLMYSGATDPRKNHIRLIQAYSKLPENIRNNHQLAIVGGMPEDHKAVFKAEAKRCGLREDECRIVGRVDDESLVSLYSLCKGYIFPSWHEGFGLPALEAIKCGCPVIAANTSSLPEVVGDQIALFNPFDVDDIAAKIELLLTDKLFREELIKKQHEHARKFNWNATATNAINAMAQLVDHSNKKQKSTQVNEIKIDCLQLGNQLSIYQPYINDEQLRQLAIFLAKSEQNSQQRELIIDISELIKHDAHTGIQRVTRALLMELMGSQLAGFRVRPVYATCDQTYRYAGNVPGLAYDIGDELNGLVRASPGDIFLGLDLVHPEILKSNRSSLEILRQRGVKTFFIVYDLIPIIYPHFANVGVSEGHSQWLDIVTEADGAICISNTVACEVKDWLKKNKQYRIDDFKIGNFNLGADIENSVPTRGDPANVVIIQNAIQARPTFLMVGTLEPRKGHQQTLEAFNLLWEKGFDANLIIVGKPGWKVSDLFEKIEKNNEFNRRLIWIRDATDEYLKNLYKQSTALIAASYCEGFGLPLIEAARQALPLIVRDIPIFKEVTGKHAYYFPDSTDPQVISDAIERWYKRWQQDDYPSSDGINNITWRQSMAQLWDCIQTMDDVRGINIHTTT